MSALDFGVSTPIDYAPITIGGDSESMLPQIERIASIFPDHPAVDNMEQILTYRELNAAANDLAWRILEDARGEHSPIAVMLDDEIAAVVALIATMKAGLPFLGIHPEYSPAQIKTILEDAKPAIVVTDEEIDATPFIEDYKRLVVGEPNITSTQPDPGIVVDPDSPLSILYTSGSTGEPKGVIWSHRQSTHTNLYMANDWHFSPSDRVSMLTSIFFGAAYPSLFCSLLAGAKVCMANLKKLSASQTLNWLDTQEISILRSTPSIFRNIFNLAAAGYTFENLRLITLGGEPVYRSDIDLFKAHTTQQCVLINNYSSTETSAIAHLPVRHADRIESEVLPAGYPAPGKQVLILDEKGMPVRDGAPGVIAVKSAFISPGYWNNTDLSTKRFTADPASDDLRTYVSGDIGRINEDGVVEVIGREDTQIKLRGYRIQLESIDQALRAIPGIVDAAVVVYESSMRGSILIAYYSGFPQDQISETALRDQLAELLPEYMIPSRFIRIAKLPRTVTGKLARRELPSPTRSRPVLHVAYREPTSVLEKQIARIWGLHLDLEQIGLDDNFFELGGDSLSVLEMSLAVEKAIERVLPPAFFENPTIAHLITICNTAPADQPYSQQFEVRSSSNDALESFGKKQESRRRRKPKDSQGTWKSRIKLVEILERVLERVVARVFVELDHKKTRQISVALSQVAFVKNRLYASRQKLFLEFLDSLGSTLEGASSEFETSIVSNLSFGLARYFGVSFRKANKTVESYLASSKRYWRSIGKSVSVIQIGESSAEFPVSGAHYLADQLKHGKGTILLTYHGLPRVGGFIPLEKLLDLDPIETISFRIPVRQLGLSERKGSVPYHFASRLNAEIALHAQRRLFQNGVINIVSDNKDGVGNTHRVEIANKVYEVKAGFAELALTSRAPIIPHYRRCLPDGRFELVLCPPLVPVGFSRNEQLQSLLAQYGSFVENSWKASPGSLRWGRIEQHFSRPSADE